MEAYAKGIEVCKPKAPKIPKNPGNDFGIKMENYFFIKQY